MKTVEVDLSKLRGKVKVFLGVPMYGGKGDGFFMKACMDTMVFFNNLGIQIQPYFLFNESLITRARNYIADEFLRSNCTHLLFIDSDINFTHEDVLVLLHTAEEAEDRDIVCGPYPKKSISWEKVKEAVDKGLADADPTILENYVGDFVFNAVMQGEIDLDEPVEVHESGTGFMLIKRKVLEDFSAAYPELHYYPDHKRTKDFSGTRKITGFFLDPLDEERHLSEDYFFCKWSRKIGKKVWLCPWMNLNHIGTYEFKGNLQAVLLADMSPTIKEEDIGRIIQ
jgi:hypothetical protein